MNAYYIEIKDDSITDRVIEFFKSLPHDSVAISKYDEEIEALVEERFDQATDIY
jgi:hypothetical protein